MHCCYASWHALLLCLSVSKDARSPAIFPRLPFALWISVFFYGVPARSSDFVNVRINRANNATCISAVSSQSLLIKKPRALWLAKQHPMGAGHFRDASPPALAFGHLVQYLFLSYNPTNRAMLLFLPPFLLCFIGSEMQTNKCYQTPTRIKLKLWLCTPNIPKKTSTRNHTNFHFLKTSKTPAAGGLLWTLHRSHRTTLTVVCVIFLFS